MSIRRFIVVLLVSVAVFVSLNIFLERVASQFYAACQDSEWTPSARDWLNFIQEGYKPCYN